jgi:hypothetical protein
MARPKTTPGRQAQTRASVRASHPSSAPSASHTSFFRLGHTVQLVTASLHEGKRTDSALIISPYPTSHGSNFFPGCPTHGVFVRKSLSPPAFLQTSDRVHLCGVNWRLDLFDHDSALFPGRLHHAMRPLPPSRCVLPLSVKVSDTVSRLLSISSERYATHLNAFFHL